MHFIVCVILYVYVSLSNPAFPDSSKRLLNHYYKNGDVSVIYVCSDDGRRWSSTVGRRQQQSGHDTALFPMGSRH